MLLLQMPTAFRNLAKEFCSASSEAVGENAKQLGDGGFSYASKKMPLTFFPFWVLGLAWLSTACQLSSFYCSLSLNLSLCPFWNETRWCQLLTSQRNFRSLTPQEQLADAKDQLMTIYPLPQRRLFTSMDDDDLVVLTETWEPREMVAGKQLCFSEILGALFQNIVKMAI